MADEDGAVAITTDEDVKAADAEITADLAKEDQSTSTEESSTEEQQTTEGEEKTEEEKPKGDESKEESDTEEGSTTEEGDETATEEDSSKPKGAETRKEQLNTEIRDLVAKRNGLRREVEQVNGEVYKPQTAEELEAEGMDSTRAEVEALKQRQELAEFNAKVTDLNANINVESLQVLADYPMFDPGTEEKPNPDFNRPLAELASALYQESANVQLDDKTKLILGTNIMPYNFYQQVAKAYEMGQQTGSVKGQRDADKNEALAETTSSAKPPTPKTDPFLEGLKPR